MAVVCGIGYDSRIPSRLVKPRSMHILSCTWIIFARIVNYNRVSIQNHHMRRCKVHALHLMEMRHQTSHDAAKPLFYPIFCWQYCYAENNFTGDVPLLRPIKFVRNNSFSDTTEQCHIPQSALSSLPSVTP